MTFDPRPTLKALQGLLDGLGVFTTVLIGEPFAPPDSLTAAIQVMDVEPWIATLSDQTDVWTLNVRLFYRAAMSPAGDEVMELGLASAVATVLGALAGEFTLGGGIRAIDFAGEAGHRMTVKFGHFLVSGTVYRCADIALSLIVDDAETYAA